MSYDFKKEEDVKEYLENLGIEYRFGCFSEKKPEVCHLLAEYLDVVKNDYHKAAKIYKSNCDDNNHPRSCHSYAGYLFYGQGVDKKNEDLAFDYFSKGCSLNYGSSCFNAGVMAMNPTKNQKRERDYTQGVSLLDKACKLGNAQACYCLSGIYITGSNDSKETPTIPKDMARAFQYSEKACNLDHLYGCFNLSLMYKKGEGVKQNEEMANKLRQKAEDLKRQINSGITIDFQRGSDS